jgi:ribonuclease D
MHKAITKYYDYRTKEWKELEVLIDKKLNFDYSHCSWFSIDGEFTGLYTPRDKDVIWTIASEDQEGNLRAEMLYTFNDDADLSVLKELLSSDKEKLLWFGKLDIAFLYQRTGVHMAAPIYDTKVASKIVRTYTGSHDLDYITKLTFNSTDPITSKHDFGLFREWMEPVEKWDAKLHQYNIEDVIYLKSIADKLKEMAKFSDREDIIDSANKVIRETALMYAKGFYKDPTALGYNDNEMVRG